MKSGQERRARDRKYAERYTLAQTREALLEHYYAHGGDMRDYQRIGQATGLSPLEADEIARRHGWVHTQDGHAQRNP